MVFEGKYLDEILRKVYGHLVVSTDTFEARKGAGRDLLASTVMLEEPRARVSASVSRGNIVSALGEFCWYLSGQNDVEFMRYYLPDYPPKDAKGALDEAYGHRLRGTDSKTGRVYDQFLRVIENLETNKDTRKACISILEAGDLAPSKTEVPCTVALQFIRRRGRIHMTTMMRSNDAYRGFIHDIFCFTMIQELVARALGIKIGKYYHFATSLHLYESDHAKAEQYLDEGYQDPTFSMPRMPPGCQLENLKKFLNAEQKIKAGVVIAPEDINLPVYWKDLALVLLQFADRKFKRGEVKRRETIQSISSGFYKPFFLEQPQRLVVPAKAAPAIQDALNWEGQKHDEQN